MINGDDFAKRLQKVIDHYGETASSFSDKIGVQRSSISHILSGRNKPSLDFVLKVLSNFPEVELYWLLNGKGRFPLEESERRNMPLSSPKSVTEKNPVDLPSSSEKLNKSIDKIVIFYTDGTFSEFIQN